ncbi:MAG TPA: D-sedoheptulose 7-phosphate isomerase [Burkholderiaceae bacterium]|jgi:D-sedoheptulose 7-phosphate isomerase|nr:D-sedoheptulose 7-phosphate isomerase [Burkholderiaceae bacterium]
MSTLFQHNLRQHLDLFERLSSLDADIARAADAVTASLRGGAKLMVCGNGGSAADSQHIASEFTGRFIDDRRPLAALALSTDSSALTCIGNDYSFAEIFARQVGGLGREGDCLLGISTSGNSANIVRAMEVARGLGIHCIGLLGRDGGRLRGLCDVAIVVPSEVTARIQEAHVLIAHTICGAVEQALGLVPSHRETP